MKLHKLLFIPFLLLNINLSCGQWQQIPSGTTTNLVDIRFVTDSIGFVLSDSGVILKTIDEGNTWSIMDSLGATFTSLTNVGSDTIYAGGNKIYRSDDGGNSWNLISTPGYTIPDLEFFDAGNGLYINPYTYICSSSTGSTTIYDYKICQSVDSGLTWQNKLGYYDPSSRLQRINDSTAYVTGNNHSIDFHCAGQSYNFGAKTSDRGNTWQGIQVPGIYYSRSYFLNDSIGYFMGINPSGGGSDLWKRTGSILSLVRHMAPSASQIIFINEIDGYTLSGSNIYKSNSCGFLWDIDTTPIVSLNKISNDFNQAMFAIGSNGVILKKQIIESLYPDSVYSMQTVQTSLAFDTVVVGGNKVKQLTIHNGGTIPLNVTVTSNDTFQVSTLNNIYSSSISLVIPPQQDSIVNVKFFPPDTLFYQDTLVISADSVSNLYIPVSGLGTFNLIGQLSDSLYLCRDTINVVGNFTVNDGGKLVICPGTVVYFKGNYRVTVSGTLVAEGLENDSIWFTPENKTVGWGGILFNTTANLDSSILRYCSINYKMNSNYNTIECASRINLIIDHCSIFNSLGGIRSSYSSIIISNNKIFNNKDGPTIGCAIKCFYDGSLIINNEIFNNTASTGAGFRAINTDVRYPKIIQNLIFNNSASGDPGAVYISEHKVHFQNNTVCNNKGSSIGGVRFWSIDSTSLCLNNIIYGNSGTQLNLYNSPNVFVGYCDIQGGYLGGINNIGFDPYFVNPTDSTGVMTNIGNYDWSLKSTSPCIDAGDTALDSLTPQFDFIGNPRIYNNTRIDIGAYEYQGVIGINEVLSNVSFSISPNPFHTTATLQLPPSFTQGQLKLYNSLGKEVHSQAITSHKSEIKNQNYAPGIYFYKVISKEGGGWSGKVVVE